MTTSSVELVEEFTRKFDLWVQTKYREYKEEAERQKRVIHETLIANCKKYPAIESELNMEAAFYCCKIDREVLHFGELPTSDLEDRRHEAKQELLKHLELMESVDATIDAETHYVVMLPGVLEAIEMEWLVQEAYRADHAALRDALNTVRMDVCVGEVENATKIAAECITRLDALLVR